MSRTILLVLSLMVTAPTIARAEGDFVPLFDGKALDGWRKVGGGATYRIDGDCIVGEVGPGANTFLRTERTYGDFLLELYAKLDVPGNSGIQFRSHQKEGDGRVFGYQCEIDPSPRAWTAGIYDEGRRGWLYPLAGHPEAQKAFKLDDWNHFVIEARGPVLKTTLNGVPCADLVDTADLEGFLALQVHAGKQGRIRWKNIRLKDLGRSHWTPLWDGKTLDGWVKEGDGTWTVEDGTIHGHCTATDAKYGLLLSKASYGDFAIRLKFLCTKGNSGFYFHVEEGGYAGVKGIQAEIDPTKDVGGLCETDGRKWIVQPKPQDVAKWNKADDWNEMSVVAIGGRIVVHVNGHKTAEVLDDPGRRRGKLALQLHVGVETDVRFKDIEVLTPTPSASSNPRPSE
jgi:hypothetical protein